MCVGAFTAEPRAGGRETEATVDEPRRCTAALSGICRGIVTKLSAGGDKTSSTRWEDMHVCGQYQWRRDDQN
jgi:hypothetical protein